MNRLFSFNCSGSSYMCFLNEYLIELLEFCYNINRVYIILSKKIIRYILVYKFIIIIKLVMFYIEIK